MCGGNGGLSTCRLAAATAVDRVSGNGADRADSGKGKRGAAGRLAPWSSGPDLTGGQPPDQSTRGVLHWAKRVPVWRPYQLSTFWARPARADGGAAERLTPWGSAPHPVCCGPEMTASVIVIHGVNSRRYYENSLVFDCKKENHKLICYARKMP